MIVWLIMLGIVAVGVGIVAGTGIYESRIDKDVANTAIYSIRSLIGSTLRISLYLPTKFYHTWSDTVVECASGPFDRFLAPVTTIEYVLCGVKGSTVGLQPTIAVQEEISNTTRSLLRRRPPGIRKRTHRSGATTP